MREKKMDVGGGVSSGEGIRMFLEVVEKQYMYVKNESRNGCWLLAEAVAERHQGVEISRFWKKNQVEEMTRVEISRQRD